MKKKATVEDIQKKIVKDMQKATDKREGTVINCDTIRPRELTDFFAKKNRERDKKMMKKIKMKYVGFDL